MNPYLLAGRYSGALKATAHRRQANRVCVFEFEYQNTYRVRKYQEAWLKNVC